MRITIITVGSRGDVQPYVALGLGLQAAGHEVRLATHSEFEMLVGSYGLDFFLLEGNPRAVLESETGQKWQRSSSNPLLFLRHLRQVAEPLIPQLMADCWNACQGADVILFSGLAFLPTYSVVEKLGIPSYPAYLQPSTATRAFPNYRFPTAPRWLKWGRGYYNRMTFTLMEQLFWWILRDPINQTRHELLQLPPLPIRAPRIPKHRMFHLYGYSQHIVPRPPDWGGWNHITGYWFLDHPQGWEPSAGLIDFLESGPPPVYVGFGSMNNRNPEEMSDIVIKALAQVGQRGVLMTGWGALSQASLPDTIFRVEEIPHDWLFPQMAAVVHHGGAGTTSAGLRAGVPSVIIPFFSDQFFWARRVQELGLGPPPIPRKSLSVDGLAAAIANAVSDTGMQARALELGKLIRAENGVAQAVAAFQLHCHLPKAA